MSEEKKQKNLISLKFSVNGKTVTIDTINVNQPLKASVQQALTKTGSARPINEYEVLFENVKLNINQKVGTFNFPEGAVIFVSLKTGQGGN